jgi:hypothetical protein
MITSVKFNGAGGFILRYVNVVFLRYRLNNRNLRMVKGMPPVRIMNMLQPKGRVHYYIPTHHKRIYFFIFCFYVKHFVACIYDITHCTSSDITDLQDELFRFR